MTAVKAKVKYKDSPFPRRRESHPKLAAKEIPAFAGMERQRQRQKLNIAQILYILDSRLRGNDGVEGRELRREEAEIAVRLLGGGQIAVFQ